MSSGNREERDQAEDRRQAVARGVVRILNRTVDPSVLDIALADGGTAVAPGIASGDMPAMRGSRSTGRASCRRTARRRARDRPRRARASLRGKRPEIVDAAIRSGLRETVFRFDLILRILVTTHDLLERERLIEAALSANLALLTSEGRAERRRDSTYLERFATLRGLLLFRVAELRAAREARATVEARYLAGHTALFPDAVKAWDEQLRSTETLADVACRLAELDGVPPAEPADPEAASVRAAEFVADLVEPAKATALEKLGEGEHSRAIATAWLRPKLAPVTAVTHLAT